MSENAERTTLGFDVHDGIYRNPSLWNESDHAYGNVGTCGVHRLESQWQVEGTADSVCGHAP